MLLLQKLGMGVVKFQVVKYSLSDAHKNSKVTMETKDMTSTKNKSTDESKFE